jgi:hypothetical protein
MNSNSVRFIRIDADRKRVIQVLGSGRVDSEHSGVDEVLTDLVFSLRDARVGSAAVKWRLHTVTRIGQSNPFYISCKLNAQAHSNPYSASKVNARLQSCRHSFRA